MSFQFHIIFTAQNKALPNSRLLVADKLTFVKKGRTKVVSAHQGTPSLSYLWIYLLAYWFFRDKVFNPNCPVVEDDLELLILLPASTSPVPSGFTRY